MVCYIKNHDDTLHITIKLTPNTFKFWVTREIPKTYLDIFIHTIKVDPFDKRIHTTRRNIFSTELVGTISLDEASFTASKRSKCYESDPMEFMFTIYRGTLDIGCTSPSICVSSAI
mmetsp:Transcript_7334/g.9555  ORF Transcript_7334/g.9555 Transcript_7334/m.9555 type:complete len:116 (+) Transcript_7334:202-549(+)